jgi:hypothetical protein
VKARLITSSPTTIARSIVKIPFVQRLSFSQRDTPSAIAARNVPKEDRKNLSEDGGPTTDLIGENGIRKQMAKGLPSEG